MQYHVLTADGYASPCSDCRAKEVQTEPVLPLHDHMTPVKSLYTSMHDKPVACTQALWHGLLCTLNIEMPGTNIKMDLLYLLIVMI